MRATALLAFLLAATAAAPAASQPEAVPLGQFREVRSEDGAHVTIRHGAVRSLTVREGSLAVSRVALAGNRLEIERCREHCPRGYRLDIELVTPELASVAVENGGIVQTSGAFPSQERVAAAVGSGGTVDIRSLSAARVAAAVAHGGRILTRPGEELTASVANGGAITYWGDARVRSSVLHGGVVQAGAAGDAERPVAQLDPQPLAPLPAPLVPPAPPILGKPMPSAN